MRTSPHPSEVRSLVIENFLEFGATTSVLAELNENIVIDDGRYITTLQHWIARAKAEGLTDLARQAEADLKLLWDSIPLQPKYKYDVPWDYESYDVFRWLLAKDVLMLKTAIDGGK